MEDNQAYGSVEDILDYAHSSYTTIPASKEKWTGQFYKINKTGFYARSGKGASAMKCFNCGKDD